jgi:hypothetical protein
MRKILTTSPASQYQTQKILQNTVGVYSSLYTANIGSLAGFEFPLNRSQLVEQAGTGYIVPQGIYWNQMSDRAVPSVQVVKTGSGSTYGASSTKHTIVRNRPGALSPGGIGVDIKHNSYERYLNKLKGKGPLRRGIISPTYGDPIPYNPAFPIYGGKTVKTSIVGGCNCPLGDNLGNQRIYSNPKNSIQDQILGVTYQFNVGDYVWALKFPGHTNYYKAQIVSIFGNNFVIQFNDGTTQSTTSDNVYIYYNCNCETSGSLEEQVLKLQQQGVTDPYLNSQGSIYCSLLSSKAASEIF